MKSQSDNRRSLSLLVILALSLAAIHPSYGQAAGSTDITPIESVTSDGSGNVTSVTLGNGATAIMGVSSSISSTGTAYGQHQNSPYSSPYGRTLEIADGIVGGNDNETTYYTANPDSYAGFTFSGPVTVTNLLVDFNTYSNGGWFGNASAGDPTSSQTLGDSGANGTPFLLNQRSRCSTSALRPGPPLATPPTTLLRCPGCPATAHRLRLLSTFP